MFEQQPAAIQEKIKQLAAAALRSNEPSAWFEILYQEAKGDEKQVPWAKLTPHPYLQDWLERHPPQVEGRSAAAVGCGLGDDAEALAALGFQVTAFDISPSAIAWCQQRFPDSTVNYVVADLFHLPAEWNQAFNFVLESRNIQALPLNVRSQAISAIGQLVALGGTLLLMTRLRDTDAEPDGPPWPLSDSELAQFQHLGCQEIRRDLFANIDSDAVKHVRIEYLRTHPLTGGLASS